MKNNSNGIVNILIACLKNKDKSHHSPNFIGNEKKYLNKCIDSTFVSTAGEFVDKFENKLAEYTKSNFVVATNSGTSALHLLLHYYKISKDDEVLVPSFTFVATVNSILYCGATPNFVDIETKNLGVCPVKLENYLIQISKKKKNKTYNKKSKKQIKALIAVHVHGFPCEIEKLRTICKKFNLILIEDGAEALGSFYKDKHLGTFGDAGVLSFNGNKIITTGSGGAILVKSKKIEKDLKHISTQAKIPSIIDSAHDRIGFNNRMSNLSAAVGCAQLENINKIIKAKRQNFILYKNAFKGSNLISIFQEPKHSKTNYWLITAKLKNVIEKNIILKSLKAKGYGLRSVWRPIHSLKAYNKFPRDNMNNSNFVFKTTINLPSSSKIFLK
jgi:perosamine synthetase